MSKKTTHDEFGLFRDSVREHLKDFVDFDYLADLSPEDRAWLAKFSSEYYQSRFRNNGTDLLPPGSQKRREQYADNNARNRDYWHKNTRVPLPDNFDDEDDK